MTREKVELEDIIGIVETDYPTNSVELKKEMYKNSPGLRHGPYTKEDIKHEDLGVFYALDEYVGDTCPIVINANGSPTNGYIADLLNEWNDWLIELLEFKEDVFREIDVRINTLEANSRQCHQSGSHEKGMEFTSQAALLERLKKALKNEEE